MKKLRAQNTIFKKLYISSVKIILFFLFSFHLFISLFFFYFF